MGGFNIYWGNRLETLADVLADVMHTPLLNPLQSEIVVVHNKGMQHWVSMRLAERNGVSANVRFPFPRAFLYESGVKLAGISIGDEYEPDILTWRIMEALPPCLSDPLYLEIRNYLADDSGGLRAYQFSAMLAMVYDRYLVYRPETIAAWEKGDSSTGEERWQADMWRKIRASCRAEHIGGLRSTIASQLNQQTVRSLLPERISIFGISNLPPLYLDIFKLLSRAIQINGFFLNPSREFWTDIRSEREMGMMVKRVRENTSWKTATSDDLYLQRGNKLLSSFGRCGRDFYAQLLQFSFDITDKFSDPGENALLEIVQSDILNLRDRGADAPAVMLSSCDKSIQIHSCHSPLREVEVLYDQLLEIFSQEPGLLPTDVVVMSPRIEAYGSFIEAVFGGREIPFSIADRGLTRGNPFVRALLAVLELLKGRFVLADVMALLDFPPVRRRFELGEQEVELMRRWAVESGIRWGTDALDRKMSGLPATSENTWQMGLERLLLGYALPGDAGMFAGIVPYGDIEGSDGEILGRLISFVETIISLRKTLMAPRSLKAWALCFLSMINSLFESSGGQDDEEDLHLLRKQVEETGAMENRAMFTGNVEFLTAKALFQNYLQKTIHPYGYLRGGVTFCSMLPMRSIPFRIVCLLGMNNGDFPRRSAAVDFDLMAKKPRPGDPSQRDEDRYLFLEALLSARKTFYISYTGLSSEDNSVIPPSGVVSELLDCLEEGFSAEAGTLREQLFTLHHLQAFHPEYFSNNSKLFSYSRENLRAARALIMDINLRFQECRLKKEFFTDPLPEPEVGWREVGIANLQSFFSNPSRYLLKKRIGLTFENGYEILPEKELFRIGGLAGFQTAETMLAYAVQGGDLQELYPVLTAAGSLPHGTVGFCEYESLAGEVSELVELLKTIPDWGKKSKINVQKMIVDVDLAIAGLRVTGRLKYLTESGLLKYRFGKIRARDLLGIWIELLLISVAEEGFSLPALFFGREGGWVFARPENAAALLEELLGLYSAGLRRPLPFFPETSLSYAEAMYGGKSEEEALRRAMTTWADKEYAYGEINDPYCQRCFGDEPPFRDGAFQETALMVFQPLLACKKRLER
ncbi:MAG: exodeoxyribonuclease V subunit gamma [Syntrophales bacterium]|jgi:exodeoxyribonuclease V gamma subunit|nr:exodeoxyribonuclease V subunit gamma [Syntrophales bacterium]